MSLLSPSTVHCTLDMDGDPLINTYKRYKAGTNKLIRWLSTNAKDGMHRCLTALSSD